MKNIFKPNCKVVSRFDLGWTEDEYNNFMIDVFTKLNNATLVPEEQTAITGLPVTITLTEADYYNPPT